MIKDMKLHHIGVATRSIVKELDYFAYLGYKPASEEFIDEEQGIRGVFMEAKDQPRLELLENLAHSTTLDGVLAKGNKFYHFAYESDDLTQDIAKMLRGGGGQTCCLSDPRCLFRSGCVHNDAQYDDDRIGQNEAIRCLDLITQKSRALRSHSVKIAAFSMTNRTGTTPTQIY
ncbi:hypothetical protein AGMMS50229_12960 [Campylobacterota bacterium]|nr:hypothetical protein AGMMS50229_12960 [Campylobacterota bacterium]